MLICMISNPSNALKIQQTRVIDELDWASFINIPYSEECLIMNVLICIISNPSNASKIRQTRVIDELNWASFINILYSEEC